MANLRLGNTFYIDTQYAGASDELAVKNIRVSHIVITATSNNARVVLSDSSLGVKIDVREETSGHMTDVDLSAHPMVFSTSIRPTTVSNAVCTLIIEETRG